MMYRFSLQCYNLEVIFGIKDLLVCCVSSGIIQLMRASDAHGEAEKLVEKKHVTSLSAAM